MTREPRTNVQSIKAHDEIERNPGMDFEPDLFGRIRINRSAVERRAATIGTRRSIKQDYQAAWLLKALTCIDLTTLAGDDTPGKVRRLCQKAKRPVRRDILEGLGVSELNITTAAVCVYHTGSQNNVRRAYSSGTPAIGVGAGNVPVIIDSSADLADAAAKICASKTFDNATSCSSENALVILDDVYEAAIAALESAGGYRATPEEKTRIVERHWRGGRLNPEVIARDAAVAADVLGLGEAARSKRFIMCEETGTGADHPLSGEKLSLVLTVYRAKDFGAAVAQVRDILNFQGIGHSCGIHTRKPAHARRLAEELDVVRVLVNQAHTFGNGGSFDNGLNFTLSMGCGTWAGNSISENLNWRHFINVTHLVTTIPEDKPSEAELFGAYWEKHGK